MVKTNGVVRTSARVVGALTTVFVLAGCQSAIPHADVAPSAVSQVRILVNPDENRELVIGEIYLQSLVENDRDARLIPIEESDVEQSLNSLESGEVDMIVGCTGNLLDALNHQRAQEIVKEMEEDPKNEEGRDFLAETHVALMGALRSDLDVTEPSTAVGCQGKETTKLPQNYVPIFRKNLLNREERTVVGSVTKFLTVRDINALAKEVRRVGSAEEVVAQWMEGSLSTLDSVDSGPAVDGSS